MLTLHSQQGWVACAPCPQRSKPRVLHTSRAPAQPISPLWSPVSSAETAETSGQSLDVSCRARPSASPPVDTPGPYRAPKKKNKKLVDINGDVVKDLGNGMFQVKLENGVGVMGHLSGKIRQNRIKIVTGDKVTVELSPYDLTRGRLTYRFKPGEYERMMGEQEAAGSGKSVRSPTSSQDEDNK